MHRQMAHTHERTRTNEEFLYFATQGFVERLTPYALWFAVGERLADDYHRSKHFEVVSRWVGVA